MVDGILILILLAIIVPAVGYIVRAKKKGQKCIGCPSASKCSHHCSCGKTKHIG